MENDFYAHIRLKPTEEKQTVTEHCRTTAEYASEVLSEVQLSDTGYLSGLLHDMGKMTDEYRALIFTLPIHTTLCSSESGILVLWQSFGQGQIYPSATPESYSIY